MNTSEYINFLSKEIGWQKSDIQRRVRSLRDEGLIGSEYAKYGKNAEKIEIYDCCYILISILVDGNSSTVAPVAREIANSKIATDRIYAHDPLNDFINLRENISEITFIDSLCKIIYDLNSENTLPAVETISLTVNYFNPEDKSMINSRIRIDYCTPINNKQRLAQVAYDLKQQTTELENQDHIGSITQTLLEINEENEVPELPKNMKILQSNFGMNFNQLHKLNEYKLSINDNKIKNNKFIQTSTNNKLFKNTSLPHISNHYSIGGQILNLIANIFSDKDIQEEVYEDKSLSYSMQNINEEVLTNKSLNTTSHLSLSIDENFVTPEQEKRKKNKRNIYLWDQDENILAWTTILEKNDIPSKEDEIIINLSTVLKKIGKLKGHNIDEKYRNPTGVYLTLMNMERYKKSIDLNIDLKTNLGQEAKNTWNKYKDNTDELFVNAKKIKQQIKEGSYVPIDL